MHVHASGGGEIRPAIEAPIIDTDASAEGLFESEVGLDSGDPRKLISVGENSGPEVTVLPRGQGLSVKKGPETV